MRNSIHDDMSQSVTQKKSRKEKEVKKDIKMKLIFMPEDDVTKSEDDTERDEEFEESGMYVSKEDVLMIYNAMKNYKPSQEEEVLYSILLESFEEILVVVYGVSLPDVVY